MEILPIILLLTFITWTKGKKSWLPEEIQNPLTDPKFCSTKSPGKSLICDPENLLQDSIKNDVATELLLSIPPKTPCFCDGECGMFDYSKRLMIGVVAISSINRSINNCSSYLDIYDCFSERVLQNWNISRCNGNNGLILLMDSQIHLYFGYAVRRRMSGLCVHRLYATIRHYVPIHFNLRALFKEIVRVIRKPCLCNDSCSFRHLKWLTNIVFLLGVIVLVTCIGGMSRRAMLAKFHHRSFSSGRHIFTDYIVRRQTSVNRPREDCSIDNVAVDLSEGTRPPDYATLAPLPKPPPYMPMPNSVAPKNSVHPQSVDSVVVTTEDSPPSYDLAVDCGTLSEQVRTSRSDGDQTHASLNVQTGPSTLPRL